MCGQCIQREKNKTAQTKSTETRMMHCTKPSYDYSGPRFVKVLPDEPHIWLRGSTSISSQTRRQQNKSRPVSTPSDTRKCDSTWSRKLGEKWKQLKRADSFESLSSILTKKRRPQRESFLTDDTSSNSEQDDPSSILDQPYDRLMLKRMQISLRIQDLERQQQKLDIFLEKPSVLSTQEGLALAQRSLDEANAAIAKKRDVDELRYVDADFIEDPDCSYQTAVDRTRDQFYDVSCDDETDEYESLRSVKITGLKDLMNGLILTADQQARSSSSSSERYCSPFKSPNFDQLRKSSFDESRVEFFSPLRTPKVARAADDTIHPDNEDQPTSSQPSQLSQASTDSGLSSSPASVLQHTPDNKRRIAQDGLKKTRVNSFFKKMKISRQDSTSSPIQLLDSEMSPCTDTPPYSKVFQPPARYIEENFQKRQGSTAKTQPVERTSSANNPLMRRELKTIKIKVDQSESLGIGLKKCKAEKSYFMVFSINGAAARSKLLRIGDEIVRVGNKKLKDLSSEEANKTVESCRGLVELQIARKPNFFFNPDADDSWDPKRTLMRSRSDSEIWGPKVDYNSNEFGGNNDYTNFGFDEVMMDDPEQQKTSGMLKFQVRKSNPSLFQQSEQDQVVVLEKSSKRLGFTIVGGVDSAKGKMGIYVKNVLSEGRAAGELRPGDEILAVNGTALQGATHAVALQKIRNAKRGKIVLRVNRAQRD